MVVVIGRRGLRGDSYVANKGVHLETSCYHFGVYR